MAEQEIKTLGRYVIQAELGKGGFAVVYQALDPNLERVVALKVMHPMLLSDPSFAQRFRREARALAALRHPNIITVYEVSEADGRLFIAMEMASGPSLAGYITEHGRVSWNETLRLMQPVCSALAYAHEQGIVHRDLKPANIMLDQERGPLLTDFGLARLISASSASTSLTSTGGILGTPAYIAPEVWEFDTAGPAADIYALGCILYEMLTGQLLFAGQTPMQILRAHDRGPQFPAAWPEDVPQGIGAVLGRALARKPEERYANPGELWRALDDLDAEDRLERERAEKAAVVQPWREEFEAALKGGEWRLARMALGRWQAVYAEDPDLLAARNRLDKLQHETEEQQQRQQAELEHQEQAQLEQERQAALRMQETERQAREAAAQHDREVERLRQPAKSDKPAQPQPRPARSGAAPVTGPTVVPIQPEGFQPPAPFGIVQAGIILLSLISAAFTLSASSGSGLETAIVLSYPVLALLLFLPRGVRRVVRVIYLLYALLGSGVLIITLLQDPSSSYAGQYLVLAFLLAGLVVLLWLDRARERGPALLKEAVEKPVQSAAQPAGVNWAATGEPMNRISSANVLNIAQILMILTSLAMFYNPVSKVFESYYNYWSWPILGHLILFFLVLSLTYKIPNRQLVRSLTIAYLIFLEFTLYINYDYLFNFWLPVILLALLWVDRRRDQVLARTDVYPPKAG